MPLDRFMIAPINSGLQKDLKPWLIADDAFATLSNAYVFRGRVRKRFGARLMNSAAAASVAQLFSRVRINLGNTVGGILAGNVRALTGHATMETSIGQLFSVGNTIFTVNNPAAGPQQMLRSDGSASVATYNLTNSDFNITGAPNATPVFFYPAEPIMGLITYETSALINDPVYAFDTEFAYEFVSGAWQRLGTAFWTGDDSQFFWGSTWNGNSAADRLLFVVNNNEPDQIKYWNGAAWTTMNPIIDSSTAATLETALIVVPFKNHLVALNTLEKVGGVSTRYTNRARWARYGDPRDPTSWDVTLNQGAQADDASTMEDIVSVEFIKDRLIVFFERSTWELIFTGNHVQPFIWQQINTELGAESTHSIVPFDKIVLGIANVGVHACNGVNVERIDTKIPDEVFNIHTGNEGVERVYGIRDYFVEQVYWTFPNVDADANSSTFPNRVLVYNYKTGSWAFNDDCITAFGYYYQQDESTITWDSTEVTWDDTSVLWGSGASAALMQQVIAGNQQGFVFIVDAEESTNCPAMQITDLLNVSGTITLTVIDHNLNKQDFVKIENLNGLTPIAPLASFPLIYQVVDTPSPNTFTIIAPDIRNSLIAGQIYNGGGVITRVSRIEILTKQYNFYVDKGRNAAISKVDFLVDRTDAGKLTIDFATSTAPDGLLAGAQLSGSLLGTSILSTAPYALYPFEQKQDRLWHPVYIQADGEAIQLKIFLSDSQMLDDAISSSPFQLHAMTFYAQPTSDRLQ